MFCSKCGESNPESAAFCQKCGADLKTSTISGAPSQSYSSSATGKKASYNFASAFSDAIELVKNPTVFMNSNRDEDPTINKLMLNYVAVLAVIPFIATLIGDSWYYSGLSAFLGVSVFGYALGAAILTYVLDIVAVFVVGIIIWKLAPSFGTSTTQVRATRVAAYAFTPAFLIAIFDLVPFLSGITVLGLLYGLYIMYLGFPILLNTPKDRVMSYLIVTVIATLIVFFVISAIVGLISAAIFVASLGFFY